MSTIGWHDDIEMHGEWESDEARVGPWTFTLRDGTPLAEGVFRNGVEVGTWRYATKRGAHEVDFGDGLRTEDALPPTQVGFDLSSYRDVHYDEPWGQLTPFAFVDAYLDWRAFVADVAASGSASGRQWADGLSTRDDVAIYTAAYPPLLDVVSDHDEAFRDHTVSSAPLSKDRSQWWWSRMPTSWQTLDRVPPS